MKRRIITIRFILFFSLFSIVCRSQTWTQVQKTVDSDREMNDNFGNAVDISGNYAIVGAFHDNEDSDGNAPLDDAGAAFIYEKDTSTGLWNQIQKITASDRGYGDEFARSVAISENGYAVVGAWGEDEDTSGTNTILFSGSAYVFERDSVTGIWQEVQKIVAFDREAVALFGFSVDIQNKRIIVGAPGESKDPDRLNPIVNAGAVYIFNRDSNDNIWKHKQKIVASDREYGDDFGYSVSISNHHLIVGARKEEEDTSNNNEMDEAGSAYIFELDTNTGGWEETQKIVASDRAIQDYFGYDVCIDGNYAIVGAYHENEDENGANTLFEAGSAYIFKKDTITGTWEEIQKIVAADRFANDHFAISVSLSGNYAILGAPYQDTDASGQNLIEYSTGAAYLFNRNELDEWTQTQKITASNRHKWARFGNAVSIDNKNIFSCAPTEYLDANEGDSVSNAGAVYIFNLDECNLPEAGTLSASSSTICENEATTITMNSGQLNEATNWYWYENACGSTSVGSGESIVVSPQHTTTYYVRGEGGCVVPGACDSISIQVNPLPNMSVSLQGNTISVSGAGSNIQWLDCQNDFSIIPGETDATFVASNNGSYAVSSSENGCVDTSDCVNVVLSGIINNSLGHPLTIYPIPANDFLYIDLGKSYEYIHYSLFNLTGKQIISNTLSNPSIFSIDIQSMASGIYFIQISNKEQSATIRFLKE